MAADDTIAAVQNFYDTLTAANFPDTTRPLIFLDEAPGTKSNPAVKIDPPYVIIIDGGEQPHTPGAAQPWAVGEAMTIWEGTFLVRSYYVSLGDAALCNKAIMWNGVSPKLKQGLAFCTLLMNTPLFSFPFNCEPGRRFRRYAGFQFNNDRVHMVEQHYKTRIHQDPE